MLCLIKGESGKAPSIGPITCSYLAVDPAHFAKDFAADIPAAQANYMVISQVPMAASICTTKIAAPAWKKKQVYGVVATKDRMNNSDSKRAIYIKRSRKSH
ncbi:hypothetical protein ABN340_21100 [Klebsiella pneumoniae]|uniref:hypothetical protein n=1 Tax=Klebsiella pneumoniae TaxID=573 RepID=UPI0020CF307A|nr:hypothetical protein [Klebsiella pneumoniae]MCQ0789123.1 hypothetical protein [Klebsiella pneumoniae]HDZ1235782.1 hypothetical protein [Klebsiella pneumoniae]HEI8884168.1 hypothetical protein [Klebsiella pneumoniae]